jgi:aminoglycoside N3'-acetyltransferase
VRLRDWNGKVLIIGEGLQCCTLFHACEELAGMTQVCSPYLLDFFSFTEINELTPAPSRRHILNTWDQFPSLEPHLIEIEALKITSLGDCALRLLDARRACDWLVPELQKDPNLILPKPSLK